MVWYALRTATMWGRVPAADRAELFDPGSLSVRSKHLHHLDGTGFREVVEQLNETVLGGGATEEEVASACEAVASLAAESSRPAIQREFARAAALAAPRDPKRAVEVGRLSREAGDFPVAEAWFQRAIALAREVGDWEQYGLAQIGLGRLWFRRGKHPRAAKFYEKAIRSARRKGTKVVEAMGHHNLFAVHVYMGRFDEAMECVRRAAELYGRGHAMLPLLAYNLAYTCMERGEYTIAYPLLMDLRSHFSGQLGMVADGGTARAAGAVGDLPGYRKAAAAVLGAPDHYADKASAVLEAALGALQLGDPLESRRMLERAQALGDRFGENRVRIRAGELLDRLGTGEEAEPVLRLAPADADRAREASAAVAEAIWAGSAA